MLELIEYKCAARGCGISWRGTAGQSPFCSSACKNRMAEIKDSWIKHDRSVGPNHKAKEAKDLAMRRASMRRKQALEVSSVKKKIKQRISGDVGKRYTRASQKKLDQAVGLVDREAP